MKNTHTLMEQIAKDQNEVASLNTGGQPLVNLPDSLSTDLGTCVYSDGDMSATFDLRDYPEQVSGLVNATSEIKAFREEGSEVIFF